MEPWAARIFQRMAKVGGSQAAIARACGIKQGSVGGWKNGSTKMIGGDNLVAVAKHLRTTPEWVITGKGIEDLNDESRRTSQPESVDPPTLRQALLLRWKTVGPDWDAIDDYRELAEDYNELVRRAQAEPLDAVVVELALHRQGPEGARSDQERVPTAHGARRSGYAGRKTKGR